ncbi:MAG: VRR-NUC domain-containing protein [Pedobacter sp.]|nr:MAG: VRR-NUC domain-containing protein [Pedobacter sp.]
MPLEQPLTFTSEAAMQAAVFQYFWNNHPVTRRRIFHVPNGGSRNKIEAVQLRAQGVVKGITDLICLGDKGFFAIELKVNGGVVSTEQKEIHSLWRSLGHKVYVCWSYEETVEVINKEFNLC